MLILPVNIWKNQKHAWAKQFTSVINKSKYQNQFRLETLTIKTISIRNRKEWEIKRSTTNIEREAVTEELKPCEGDDGGGRLEYERDDRHDAFLQKHRVRESQDDGDCEEKPKEERNRERDREKPKALKHQTSPPPLIFGHMPHKRRPLLPLIKRRIFLLMYFSFYF